MFAFNAFFTLRYLMHRALKMGIQKVLKSPLILAFEPPQIALFFGFYSTVNIFISKIGHSSM